MPFLICLKKTGPLDCDLINKANIGVSQLRIKTITIKEIIISKSLLKNLFILSFKGTLRKDKIGIVS
jgi:hypothetical protein